MQESGQLLPAPQGCETFTVDGVQFCLKPLSLEAKLDLLEAIAGLFGAIAKSDWARLAGTRRLVASFLEHSSYNMSGNWVACYAHRDVLFQRKMLRLFEWTGECVLREFGDFLDAGGQDALSSMGERFASRLGFGGKSGGSQPTLE